ncbi:MAG TPA: hypothetical protein VLC46_01045 [Thermoanaerobaculia bacterium]|jgi:hypothetical protein|nr:hypothetical protein [Thermoanaerobaculia bacterium]
MRRRLWISLVVAGFAVSTATATDSVPWSATVNDDIVTIRIATDQLDVFACIARAECVVIVDGKPVSIPILGCPLRKSKQALIQHQRLAKTPKTFEAKSLKMVIDDCRLYPNPP